MKNAFLKLPNYIRRFGVADGVRLAAAIERTVSQKSHEQRGYRVPGYEQPVWLRETVADHAIFWQCLVMEQYAFDRFPQSHRLEEQYQSRVSAGEQPIIVDCGANIGLSCLWFSRRFPQARIVAVEPDGDNFEMLRRNTAHLGERVQLVRGGVWPESGWLRICNPESGSAAFRVIPAEAESPDALRAFTIDELCTHVGGGTLLVAKVDIEGAQAHLFARNTSWVAKAHLITLELDDWLFPWAGTSRTFFASLSKYPFEYLLGGESIFCFRDWQAELDPKR